MRKDFRPLFFTGVVTSPNYPGYYPYNLDKTYMIQVEQGEILLLQFNAFDVAFKRTENGQCNYDFLTIKDGDGTSLLDKACSVTTLAGEDLPGLPGDILSNTNVVKLIFHTTGMDVSSGWSLNWTALPQVIRLFLEQNDNIFFPQLPDARNPFSKK